MAYFIPILLLGFITTQIEAIDVTTAAVQPEFHFHPETIASFKLSEKCQSLVNLSAPNVTIETFRKFVQTLWELGKKDVEYDGERKEVLVPSDEVKGGIPIYVYTPRSVPRDATIMIYSHGGGNILGSREQVEDTCKMLSSEAHCIVVNVEYRLAPEHKFPAMVDDVGTVVRWVMADPTVIGGTKKSKVGVSGDSAGGLISASVAHDIPGLAFQILIYPLLSGATHSSPSFKEFENAPFALTHVVDRMESMVANKREDLDSPRYHILGHKKYDHLPPTLCIVAEYDQLRDDSYEYSKRLTAAGVENEVFCAKGATHGYYTAPGPCPQLCRESYAKAVEFLKKFQASRSSLKSCSSGLILFAMHSVISLIHRPI